MDHYSVGVSEVAQTERFSLFLLLPGQASFLLNHYFFVCVCLVLFLKMCEELRLQSQLFSLLLGVCPVRICLTKSTFIGSSVYIPFFPFILINNSSLSIMFMYFKYLSALLLSPFSHCLLRFMFSSWQLPSDIGKRKISSSAGYSFRVQAATDIFRATGTEMQMVRSY